MKFLIVTHTPHIRFQNKIYAYEPYVREMNIWTKYVSETRIIAPLVDGAPKKIDSEYTSSNIDLKIIPAINFVGLSNKLRSLIKIPVIFFTILKHCFWADHIHLRCPGNIGLLGCIVQVFFPSKEKTAKYAGNWDPESKQPLSYRFQKWILSNTFLTRNIKVLVYGEWKNQSKNVVPFFTATYSKDEIIPVKKMPFDKIGVHFIYVGALVTGKQPLISIKSVQKLHEKGLLLHLDIYGDGILKNDLENYVQQFDLKKVVTFHGNVNKDEIKKAFQKAHFLIFISKSEGWPKVIAEAMFWGCVPITTDVSCVSSMLHNEERGSLVSTDIDLILEKINSYFKNPEIFKIKSRKAREWSQQYTLEKFEKAIKILLHE